MPACISDREDLLSDLLDLIIEDLLNFDALDQDDDLFLSVVDLFLSEIVDCSNFLLYVNLLLSYVDDAPTVEMSCSTNLIELFDMFETTVYGFFRTGGDICSNLKVENDAILDFIPSISSICCHTCEEELAVYYVRDYSTREYCCRKDSSYEICTSGLLQLETYTTVNVTKSNFMHNLASASDGGCFSLKVHCYINITASTFQENFAFGNGGIIYSAQQNHIVFLQSSIAHNKAGQNGGAIASYSDAFIGVEISNFTANIGDYFGGALFSSETDMMSISISSFYSNWAALGRVMTVVAVDTLLFSCERAGQMYTGFLNGEFEYGLPGYDETVEVNGTVVFENAVSKSFDNLDAFFCDDNRYGNSFVCTVNKFKDSKIVSL